MGPERGSSVAIIGCGINGLFCAYYLLKEGYSVTIIDRNKHGVTSKNNAGLLTPSLPSAPEMGYADIAKASTVGLGAVYISPSQILRNISWFMSALKHRKERGGKALMSLGSRSVELYGQFLRKEHMDADVIRGVGAFYESEDDARTLAEEYDGRFIGSSDLSGMGYTNLGGGIMFDKELSINSMKLFDGLRSRVRKLGARLLLGTEAELICGNGSVEHIISGSEKVTADTYIAAGGSWSNDLLKPTGYNPMIIPARGLVLLFSTGKQRIISAPALLEPEGVAVAQHSDNLFRATSFFEFKGTKSEFSEGRKRWLLDMLESHIIKYSRLKQIYEGSGFRPCTPDQMPVVGRVPGYSNLLIAGGQCRVGVTLAPITGKIITDMVNGAKPKVSGFEYLSPARFS
jgi:D-amino-acid dehydrogenase